MQEVIKKLKKARAMYIDLKLQHSPKSILKHYGDECIRLRKRLNHIMKGAS